MEGWHGTVLGGSSPAALPDGVINMRPARDDGVAKPSGGALDFRDVALAGGDDIPGFHLDLESKKD